MEKITVLGDRLVDSKGRHVILNGINLVYKGEKRNGTMNYIGPWTEADFVKFKEWGFNVVRLGLIWDAVEPEPGIYDESYLDWIGSMLGFCAKYEIYAYLDMHQDLYSVLYSDGAPEWATITDGQPHVGGDLWSDAYLFSEAVKRAFDHFWANSPAHDGKGLQDHYADMWIHIAERFAGHPALLGYDFLNEPYPGSAGMEVFGTLMGTLAELVSQADGKEYTIDEMIGAFSNPVEKLHMLGLLENKDFYTALVKPAEAIVEQFDKGALAAFYEKITRAVRTVDPDSLIMRENSYFSNMGIECKAEPIRNASGQKEPMQVFSPHGYDLVVDTEAVVMASNKRAEVIFEAHRRAQQRMSVPVIVGEWGAHGQYAEGLEHIEFLLSLFEKYLWSHTYWCYESKFDHSPVRKILIRPYPQAVCGELLSYRYDRQTDTFYMEWEERNCDASSVIYLPAKEFSVELNGEYSAEIHSCSTILTIAPSGGRRTLAVKLKC